MFKNLIATFFILGLIFFAIYSYAKNNIINKITTEFSSIEFSGFNLSFPNPTIDLRLKFNVFNGSNYNYLVRHLNVTIYDNENNLLVAKSRINEEVPIRIGNNQLIVDVPNVSFLDNANNYLNNNIDLFVVVEFKILGISIITQEIIKI